MSCVGGNLLQKLQHTHFWFFFLASTFKDVDLCLGNLPERIYTQTLSVYFKASTHLKMSYCAWGALTHKEFEHSFFLFIFKAPRL